MSCRSLIFTANTVRLRCQTATQTVGGTYHATALDPTRLPDLLLSPDSRRARVGYSSQDLTQVHQAWRMIVQDYTRRALSEPSDKLIACAGLAEEFARVLRSEYLAGLWSDSLFEDLLWVRSSLCLPRPSYRAPSWTWASVDGETVWLRGDPSDRLETLAEDAQSRSRIRRSRTAKSWMARSSSVRRCLHVGSGARVEEAREGI